MQGYDAWVTREPDYLFDKPLPLPRCSTCGEFMQEQPEGFREWVTLERCSGEPKVIECKYGDVASDEGLLRILGEEYRGKSYRVAYAAACGSMNGSNHATYDGEIAPDVASEWKHAPHWFVAEWGYQRVAVRTCSRGHVNEEALD